MAAQLVAPGIIGEISTEADHKAIVITAIISLVLFCIIVFTFIAFGLWIWWDGRQSKRKRQTRDIAGFSAVNYSGDSFEQHRQKIYNVMHQLNKQSLI